MAEVASIEASERATPHHNGEKPTRMSTDDASEMEWSNPVMRERFVRAYRRVAQEVQRQAQLRNTSSQSSEGDSRSGQEEAAGDTNQAPPAERQELIYDQLRLF